jgi:hypothetical protein
MLSMPFFSGLEAADRHFRYSLILNRSMGVHSMNHQRVLAAASLVAALATAAIASSAQAGEVGFYLGGQYGQTQKETVIQDFDVFATGFYNSQGLTPTSSTSSIDDSFAGYGFYGGYRFNTHLAVEGGYLNLGSFRYRSRVIGNIGGVDSPGTLNYDGETSGLTVAAIGVWPMSYRWELYGRAGVLFATNTASLYYADIARAGPVEGSDSSVDILAGVGTSLAFLEIYALRLEFQRVFDAGAEEIGEGDADTISIGISVVF